MRSPHEIRRELAAKQVETADAEERVVHLKERLLELEDELRAAEGLRPGNDSGITSDVTRAQSKRRGRAIAKGKAASTIAKAIAKDDRWGSLTKYARRLRISQPALSRYLSGDLDVPPEVAAAVKADFGLDADAWPKRRS